MNFRSSLLEQNPSKSFYIYLNRCKEMNFDVELIHKTVIDTLKYLKSSKTKRSQLRLNQDLENHWYKSVLNGTPDYGVYDTDLYMADLWACWILYSRKYLKICLSPKNSIFASMKINHGKIIDLGCGIGYSTAVLAELFPDTQVIGTNIENIKQTKFAQKMGKIYGFGIESVFNNKENVDLVFASEYFEHFYKPIEHLKYILTYLNPKFILVANTFTAKSIGHFDKYFVNGLLIPGHKMSRLFSATLESYGYKKIKINVWNNRPQYWMRN